MYSLLVETSTDRSIIAVCDGVRCLRQHEFGVGSDVAPLVAGLLKSEGLALQDIQCIVCGVGPGSYTGIRVAISFCMGLQKGIANESVKVIPITTLIGFVPEVAGSFIAALDAKIGGVYCLQGVKSVTGECFWQGIPQLLTDSDFQACASQVEYVVTQNSAWIEKKGLGLRTTVITRAPSVECMIIEGLTRFKSCDQQINFELSPLYLRKTEAEREKAGN